MRHEAFTCPPGLLLLGEVRAVLSQMLLLYPPRAPARRSLSFAQSAVKRHEMASPLPPMPLPLAAVAVDRFAGRLSQSNG